MPPPTPQPLQSESLQDKSLLWVVLGATVLFFIVLWPLSGAVSWAVFLAIVFSSLQERTVTACRGRRGWAALSTLLVIVLSVLLPFMLLAASITHEATAAYDRFKAGDVQLAEYFQRAVDALPAWARSGLDRFGLADVPALQRKIVQALGSSSQALTTRAFTIGHNTLEFMINFFVMLYLLFFLLRDGKSLVAKAPGMLPLRKEHSSRLLSQFATVVRATVKGNVVVALVQGALGALAFWVVGLTGPLLWGALMALLSLVPAIGHVLVWGPAALYLFATGAVVQAIGLVLWCVFVIGLVDNFLRPILVGKETKLPDYLVLIATLGGLAVFGLNGFVIGPVIAAVFISAWEILAEARRDEIAPAPTPAPTAVPVASDTPRPE